MQLCSATGMRVVVDGEGRPYHSGSELVSDEDGVDTWSDCMAFSGAAC